MAEKNRIQGMVRSIDQYRNGQPKAVAAGSHAQILYALEDSRHDLIVLWDSAVAIGERNAELEEERGQLRDFLGKVQGVCMGVCMSGRDHPNPDGALMELFNEAQAILFPPAAKVDPACCGRPIHDGDPEGYVLACCGNVASKTSGDQP